ncbi:MAG: VanZ family protein [Syntrophomonadaceae bacterium]
MKKRWLWWILAGLFFIGFYHFTASPLSNDAHTLKIIAKLKHLSPIDIQLLDKIIRKLAHLVSYGVLALIVKNALHPYRWAYPGAWLTATLYGASDEYHQIFVPGRTPLFTDVMIDSLGAFLFLSVLYLINLNKKKA